MKINHLGIYGDSFGAPSKSGDFLSQQKGMQYHWSTLLTNEFNCKFSNYSKSGSSVYYSYKKFLETYQNHDVIIFLVTSPDRYIKPLDFSFEKGACMTNKNQIEMWKKNTSYMEESDLNLLDKLEHWFDLTDLEYCYDITELIVEKIISLKKDIIILPCYDISLRDSFKSAYNIPKKVNLCSLYYRQMEELNLSDEGMNTAWAENAEFISGHLTPEFNKVAYDNIISYLRSNKWNWVTPSTLTSFINSNNKDNYYHLRRN